MDLMTELVETEPSSFKEAVKKPVWVDAIMEEYKSIMKNNVWEVVPIPEKNSVVGSIWIFKVKHAVDRSIEKYKAGFVAKEFSQFEGIDYEETFILIARYSSIRSILALATHIGWNIHQMDVKIAFLNVVIEGEVYIEKPEGLIHLIRSLMCEKTGKHCTVPNRHPELGTLRLIVISLDWATTKVKWM